MNRPGTRRSGLSELKNNDDVYRMHALLGSENRVKRLDLAKQRKSRSTEQDCTYRSEHAERERERDRQTDRQTEDGDKTKRRNVKTNHSIHKGNWS